MSKPTLSLTPAELEAKKKIRRRQIRESVARHNERLNAMTNLEQAAWKARASLGENYSVYNAAEKDHINRIANLKTELEGEVEALRLSLKERLMKDVSETPALFVLLTELETGEKTRINLKPY